MKKISWLHASITGVLILASFAGGYTFALHQQELLSAPLSRYVLQVVQKEYIDPYTDEMLARGIVYGTGDPFSMYFTKEEYQSFETQLSEKYVGIGVLISEQEGRLVIMKVFPNSPAEKGGIKPLMEIILVDDEVVFQQGLDKAAKMIRGPIGTLVKITAKEGELEKDFSLIRDHVVIETVESQWLRDDIAYIRIVSFNFGTAKHFQEIISGLLAKNPKALILDMRDNSGGVLDETIHVAETLLPSNSVLLQTRGRDKVLSEVRIGQSIPLQIPLFVMVNRNSASAAEVLAGAIQDLKVGTIIGEKTYGKASIQKIFPVPFQGSAIKLTIQKYLTPAGRDINRNGIDPDLLFKDLPESNQSTTDVFLERVLEYIIQKED
jgi:carboxyl-terminal processing protease